MNYLAKAEEASRRWREAQGLPPRDQDDLSSISLLPSLREKEEKETSGWTEEETGSEREEIEERKGDKTLSPYYWRPTYAHPWPDELPGLGPRHVGPFDPCQGCGRGSWVRYGRAVLCLVCAEKEAT